VPDVPSGEPRGHRPGLVGVPVGFSLDRLFRFLKALGRDVEIVIRPADRPEGARTQVISD
jgi:hypothetical protein